MAYKNKTEAWLYEMNRPGARLEGLVPTPAQYRRLKNAKTANNPEYGNQLRREYTAIMQGWQSRHSPTRRAETLQKIFRTGFKFHERSSFQSRRLLYGYANIRNAGLYVDAKVKNANYMSNTYHAPVGSAYKNKKTQAHVSQYFQFMHMPVEVLYAEPEEVVDVTQYFEVYDPGTEHDNTKPGQVWVLTDKRIQAKNGSKRGSSVNVYEQALYSVKDIYDQLAKENALYHPRVESQAWANGVDPLTGFR